MSSPSSLSIEITLPNGKTYTQPTGLFINNEFVPGNSTPISVHDPSTGNLITSSIHSASRSDVDLAVSAARTCLSSSDPSSWPSLPAVSRGELLTRLANLIHRDRELLAAIDAFDNGKRYQDALEADIEESWQVFRYYAGWADKISGKTIETGPGKLCYTLQEPLGVCAQIIPWFVVFSFLFFFSFFGEKRGGREGREGKRLIRMFEKKNRNFPFMMLAWKVAPAIACGNAVVVKSAEQTPLSALYFGKLVQEAGAPPGLINILSGYGKEAGAALAEHMDVDKVAFTGSTATGRTIMKAASANLKNITLECGGKSPSIVFADANLEQAVKWTHSGGVYTFFFSFLFLNTTNRKKLTSPPPPCLVW